MTPYPTPGSTFGRYDLVRAVTSAGVAVEYVARDRERQREVALTLFPAASFPEPATRSRWLREAAAVARIESPYVVRVLETGESGPWVFTVHEREIETSLAQTLRERGPMSAPQAVRLLDDIAVGLGALQAEGVFQERLDPTTVAVRESLDGRWQVLVRPLSVPGETPGLDPYVAPERRAGHRVSAASDIYALGGILGTMLTGAPYIRERSCLGEIIRRRGRLTRGPPSRPCSRVVWPPNR
ncbi:hypothetical protein GCM10027020_19330 [Nocardioides salsibiostraticola]